MNIDKQKATAFVEKHQTEIGVGLNLTSALIGTVVGWKLRRKMYDAGMVKSMWFGLPKKVGTYRTPEGFIKVFSTHPNTKG